MLCSFKAFRPLKGTDSIFPSCSAKFSMWRRQAISLFTVAGRVLCFRYESSLSLFCRYASTWLTEIDVMCFPEKKEVSFSRERISLSYDFLFFICGKSRYHFFSSSKVGSFIFFTTLPSALRDRTSRSPFGTGLPVACAPRRPCWCPSFLFFFFHPGNTRSSTPFPRLFQT